MLNVVLKGNVVVDFYFTMEISFEKFVGKIYCR